MSADDTGRNAVFVSDFDGTIARPDFYQLTRAQLVPDGTPDYWELYRSGEMTHFDALKAFFAAAEGGEEALRGIVDQMEMPDHLPQHVAKLRQAGWKVVVVSAGCTWYIHILLERAGVDLPVYANPGRIEEGRLIMERPDESPFACRTTGIDKAAIVQMFLDEGRVVAFAGDGFPDLDAAQLVGPERRFARADLARVCRKKGLVFQPFEAWTEVVGALVKQ